MSGIWLLFQIWGLIDKCVRAEKREKEVNSGGKHGHEHLENQCDCCQGCQLAFLQAALWYTLMSCRPQYPIPLLEPQLSLQKHQPSTDSTQTMVVEISAFIFASHGWIGLCGLGGETWTQHSDVVSNLCKKTSLVSPWSGWDPTRLG